MIDKYYLKIYSGTTLQHLKLLYIDRSFSPDCQVKVMRNRSVAVIYYEDNKKTGCPSGQPVLYSLFKLIIMV